MMKIALLDPQGIYLGESEINAADFNPAMHVDASDYGGRCDLPRGPGCVPYRWSRERKCFEPVHSVQEAFARDLQRVIEFAAAQAVALADPELQPIIQQHFPAEYRLAQLALASKS
jgi:hypothetical protein